MAGDLASMMYGSAEQAAQTQGQGLAQGAQAGVQNYNAAAQLAMKQQELDQSKQMMQAKLGEIQTAKLSKYVDAVKIGADMPDGPAKNAYNTNILPQTKSAMGLDDLIHPVAEQMLQKDGALSTFITSGIADGSIPMAVLGDPNQIAKLAQAAHIDASAEEVKSYSENYPKDTQAAYEKYLERESSKQKAQLEVAAAQKNKEATFAHEDATKAAAEMVDFGKMVSNPSTKSVLGTTKAMVDAADSVKQLTDAKLPANATREERIAAYNKLTTQQQNEVISGMDRMISRGNPTVTGKEGLTPPTTPEELLSKYGQILGNVPVGASKGEFIDNMMGTINRERKMNADKFEAQTEQLKSAHTMARKFFGDEIMNKVIGAAVKAPAISDGSDSGLGGFKMPNGKTYDKGTLEKFIDDPKNANDPLFSAAKQALGVQ